MKKRIFIIIVFLILLCFLGWFLVTDLRLFPTTKSFVVNDLSDLSQLEPISKLLEVKGNVRVYTTERYRFDYFIIECELEKPITAYEIETICTYSDNEEDFNSVFTPFLEIGNVPKITLQKPYQICHVIPNGSFPAFTVISGSDGNSMLVFVSDRD